MVDSRPGRWGTTATVRRAARLTGRSVSSTAHSTFHWSPSASIATYAWASLTAPGKVRARVIRSEAAVMGVVRAPCAEAPWIASRYRSRIPTTERGLATARARPQACRARVARNGAQDRAARALGMIVSDEYQGVARAASRTRRAASAALRWSMVVNRALEKARTSSRRSRWVGMTISRRVSESLSVFKSTAAISWPFMGPSEVRTRPLSTHTSSFSRTARLGSVSHMRGTGVPVRVAFSRAAAVTSAAFIVPVAFTAAPPGRRRSASHPGTRPRRPPPSLPRPKQAGTRPARHPRRTRPRRRPVRRRRGPVRAGDPCAASPSRAWCPFSGPFLWWIHPGSGRGKSPVGRSRHGRAAGMLGGGAVVPAAVLALGRDIDAGVALLADVGVVGLARRTGPRHAPPRVGIHVVHVRAGGIVARRRHDDRRLPRLGVVSHLLDPRRGRLTGLDPGAGRTVTVGGDQLCGVLAGQGRAARLERGPHRLGHLRSEERRVGKARVQRR